MPPAVETVFVPDDAAAGAVVVDPPGVVVLGVTAGVEVDEESPGVVVEESGLPRPVLGVGNVEDGPGTVLEVGPGAAASMIGATGVSFT